MLNPAADAAADAGHANPSALLGAGGPWFWVAVPMCGSSANASASKLGNAQYHAVTLPEFLAVHLQRHVAAERVLPDRVVKGGAADQVVQPQSEQVVHDHKGGMGVVVP
jgi:hypothetical protein